METSRGDAAATTWIVRGNESQRRRGWQKFGLDRRTPRYHVGSGDVDGVIEKCKQEGIHFMSFSSLCGPCDVTPEDNLINGQLVSAIAAKYNVTGSQVSLRFVVQQALDHPDFFAGVIPKSTNPDHIASNADLFGFELSADDMATLKAATLPAGEAGDCDVP